MLMDKHRPLKINGISVHSRIDVENNTIVILKDVERGIYVKTSAQGLFVWNLLDGDHTLQDIAVAYFYKYGKLATETIGNLVLHLIQCGMVKSPMLASYVPQPNLSAWQRCLAWLNRIFQYEYALTNVDKSMTRVYQSVGYLFFTLPAKIIMALISVLGFFTFTYFFPQASIILKNTPHAWVLLLLTVPANIIAVPLHELAHAITTKAYGYQVHRLGVGWFWLGLLLLPIRRICG